MKIYFQSDSIPSSFEVTFGDSTSDIIINRGSFDAGSIQLQITPNSDNTIYTIVSTTSDAEFGGTSLYINEIIALKVPNS